MVVNATLKHGEAGSSRLTTKDQEVSKSQGASKDGNGFSDIIIIFIILFCLRNQNKIIFRLIHSCFMSQKKIIFIKHHLQVNFTSMLFLGPIFILTAASQNLFVYMYLSILAYSDYIPFSDFLSSPTMKQYSGVKKLEPVGTSNL